MVDCLPPCACTCPEMRARCCCKAPCGRVWAMNPAGGGVGRPWPPCPRGLGIGGFEDEDFDVGFHQILEHEGLIDAQLHEVVVGMNQVSLHLVGQKPGFKVRHEDVGVLRGWRNL